MMMKINTLLSIAVIFFSLLSFNVASQNVVSENPPQLTNIKTVKKSELLSSDVPLPINERILSLLKLSENSPEEAIKVFIQVDEINESFNIAEQYLMLLIRARNANYQQQFQKAINWGKQAFSMEESMSIEQLFSPDFSQIHKIISTSYVQTGQYKLAFKQKELYLDKYKDYRKKIRDDRLAKLNKKYATDLKIKENELLEKQHQLKTLQLREAKAQSKLQRRNIVILVVTAIVFLLLLIRQLKIRSMLKVLAKTDSLTGLYNRRTLFEKGTELFNSANKEQSALSIILFDIDHFKSVNDSYGHDVGDKTIRAIAKLGRDAMRSKDVFARLGGEEFVAVLPNTDVDEAKAIAEHFREKVEQHKFRRVHDKQITISAGVACSFDNFNEFNSLLNAADSAMYQAKSEGRNKVSSYCDQSE